MTSHVAAVGVANSKFKLRRVVCREVVEILTYFFRYHTVAFGFFGRHPTHDYYIISRN
jgi:hypothetical protein